MAAASEIPFDPAGKPRIADGKVADPEFRVPVDQIPAGFLVVKTPEPSAESRDEHRFQKLVFQHDGLKSLKFRRACIRIKHGIRKQRVQDSVFHEKTVGLVGLPKNFRFQRAPKRGKRIRRPEFRSFQRQFLEIQLCHFSTPYIRKPWGFTVRPPICFSVSPKLAATAVPLENTVSARREFPGSGKRCESISER
ncbi:MAG: hypothetical protein BWY31_04503 [Lentisphaerae bacterium ADurb.Bin242]|nr:MAG: hypothetical protein BWY31_04503 [Lentisphaerae bacterium ADurb.Bin242]